MNKIGIVLVLMLVCAGVLSGCVERDDVSKRTYIKIGVIEEVTFDTLFESASEDVKNSIKEGVRLFNEKRKELVDTIMNSSKNTFAEEQLKSKDIAELEAIANFAKEDKKVTSFLGQGDVVKNTTEIKPLKTTIENVEKENE